GFLVARWAVPSFIATVGMLSYARGVAYYLGGGMPVEFPPPSYAYLGSGYLLRVPVSVWVAGAVFVALHVLLHRTALGRQMFATGGNREAARLSGIRTQRVEFVGFLLAGLVTGLTALVLSSRVMSGQPTIAATLQFEAIAAVAIGGTRLGGGDGSMFRTAVGTLIIAALSNGLTLANVSTFVQQMLIGAIMVGAVAVDQWQRRRGGPA
ncbi:MAG TPA: ABC transporter permease, partial [Trueperaceae bacterium]